MSHLPISFTIQEIIDHMKKITKEKKQSTSLFDEPELSYHGEKDVIK